VAHASILELGVDDFDYYILNVNYRHTVVSRLEFVRQFFQGAPLMYRYMSFACSALLLLCLIDMPYWYYKVAGIAACLTCALRAVEEYQNGNMASILAILFGFCALLFNPFVTPKLGRTAWNIVDVALAALLIVPYVAPSLKRKDS